MSSVIDTIRVEGEQTDEEWAAVCQRAYDRLLLDPRVEGIESVRGVEFVGGTMGYSLFRACASTKGGDVLKVNIFKSRTASVQDPGNVVR